MSDVFPDPWSLEPDETGLVALGGRLTPELVIEAYRKGIFPWTGEDPIPWYSPDPRMILEPRAFRRTRSLMKWIRQGRYEVRFDTDFRRVMRECARMPRPGQDGTWITPNMLRVYGRLSDVGIAHSVETWEGDTLVGGLYGLSFGRTFYGESMFAHRDNASKFALEALCRHLEALDFEMIDCQQETRHLKNMGGVAISRADFLRRLERSLEHPSHHYRWSPGAPGPSR